MLASTTSTQMSNYNAIFSIANFEKDLTTEAIYQAFKSDLDLKLIKLTAKSQLEFVSDVEFGKRKAKELKAINQLKFQLIGLETGQEELLESGTPEFEDVQLQIDSLQQKIADREAKYQVTAPLFPSYEEDFELDFDQQRVSALQECMDTLTTYGVSKGWEVAE